MTVVDLSTRLFIIYPLCVYYNVKYLLLIVLGFFSRPKSKFWVHKSRPVPPKCLTSEEFGQHKYILTNGLKFHYVEKGDPTKPLMLFIHGFPEFWYSWRYQLKEFSKDYWAVALDMRGYGNSSKPDGVAAYQVDNMTTDIKEFIIALGREKCILVGHDWGAVIGWHFVDKHNGMVDKYIMMDAPSMQAWNKIVRSDWKQFRMSWYIFMFQVPYLPEFFFSLYDYKMLEMVNEGKRSKYFTEEDLEAYKYTFSQRFALNGPINYYRANLTVPRNTQRLAMDTPGLYLQGECDRYISKASGPLLQSWYPKLNYELVKGGNHFVQQDKPEEVNALIRTFLQKHN